MPKKPELKRIMINRETVKEHDDRVREWVDIPEWDGGTYVKGISAKERDIIEKMSTTIVGPGQIDYDNTDVRAKMVVLGCVTEEWGAVFTDADIPWLNEKSSKAVDRIVEVVRDLGGMVSDAVKKAAKNSN